MSGLIGNLGSAKDLLNSQNLDDVLTEVDEGKRRKLQETIFEMYRDLLAVCERHGIVPYLVGGSALGAVRHQGFIPWDDDLDVGMEREEYEKFLRIFQAEMSEKYSLNAPNVSPRPKSRFTKILKKGTVFREFTEKEDIETGIFLDVFIIENIPENALVRRIRGTYCNFLQFISGQVYLYENDNDVLREVYSRSGDSNYKIRKQIGRLFSFRSSAGWFDKVDRAANYRKKTGLVGLVTGRKHYFGEIFPRDTLFPAKTAEFCGIQAPVFNDLDTYLTNLYGDYMQIPPENKRERHYLMELDFGEEGSA